MLVDVSASYVYEYLIRICVTQLLFCDKENYDFHAKHNVLEDVSTRPLACRNAAMKHGKCVRGVCVMFRRKKKPRRREFV